MGFFKIENDLLVIDKDEVRGIPVFKAILERDKGSKGDNDGRKKLFAFKEFLYIYFIIDYRSWIVKAGYNDKEKHLKALKSCGLPDDYKPDSLLKEAIQFYEETQLDQLPSLRALRTIIKGLKLADTIGESIIKNIETAIELHQKRIEKEIEENIPHDIGSDLLLTQGLNQQLKQLIDLSTIVPKSISTLKDLEEKVNNEKSDIAVARGGKEIGNRADPKR